MTRRCYKCRTKIDGHEAKACTQALTCKLCYGPHTASECVQNLPVEVWIKIVLLLKSDLCYRTIMELSRASKFFQQLFDMYPYMFLPKPNISFQQEIVVLSMLSRTTSNFCSYFRKLLFKRLVTIKATKVGYGQLSTFGHYARKQLSLYSNLTFCKLLNNEEFIKEYSGLEKSAKKSINVELRTLRAIDSIRRLFSNRSETIAKYQYKYVYSLVKFLLP